MINLIDKVSAILLIADLPQKRVLRELRNPKFLIIYSGWWTSVPILKNSPTKLIFEEYNTLYQPTYHSLGVAEFARTTFLIILAG